MGDVLPAEASDEPVVLRDFPAVRECLEQMSFAELLMLVDAGLVPAESARLVRWLCPTDRTDKAVASFLLAQSKPSSGISSSSTPPCTPHPPACFVAFACCSSLCLCIFVVTIITAMLLNIHHANRIANRIAIRSNVLLVFAPHRFVASAERDTLPRFATLCLQKQEGQKRTGSACGDLSVFVRYLYAVCCDHGAL